MLEVLDLRLAFGGVAALRGATITVRAGSTTALIGPNGAGKTTAFNCISRIDRPDSGTIRFEGRDLLAHKASDLAALGIARTFQHSALFASMSVRDNLRVGERVARLRQRASGASPWSTEEVVDWLGIGAELDRSVGELSLGMQKRVELARALATTPRLLMLDEPAGGLHLDDVAVLSGLLRDLGAHFGVTVLIVEHNMSLVMSLSDHIVVLAAGATIASGTPKAIRENREVQRVYLGA